MISHISIITHIYIYIDINTIFNLLIGVNN